VTDVNGYPIYRRKDTRHTVVVHGIELDNRWVVPHNVYLSTKYDAHINIEVYNNICVVKYIFKYVYKGHDRGTVEISRQNDNATKGNVVDIDEIKKYLDYRYVSASEAAWRIFKFDMHERFPTVERNGHRLEDFPMLPKSNYIPFVHGGKRLVQEKLAYDQHSLTTNANNAEDRLNDDQCNTYETILNVVINKKGKLFFMYGSGGTGKTFVWTTLMSCLQGQGKIVLAVASSGIASLLLPGGRTAHSRFKIDLHNESTCNITQQMKVAELVRKADLIIWDEAPMIHRRAFEVINRTLHDLMQLDDAQATRKIFSGKTVVLGGDFRQILPVVPKAG